MEQPTNEVISSEGTVGRRQLLKALAATGGIVAASLLPVKWSKPVVEAGELSAHAQASPVPPDRPRVQIRGTEHENADSPGDDICAGSNVGTRAWIIPEYSGVLMRRTITWPSGSGISPTVTEGRTGSNPSYPSHYFAPENFSVPQNLSPGDHIIVAFTVIDPNYEFVGSDVLIDIVLGCG